MIIQAAFFTSLTFIHASSGVLLDRRLLPNSKDDRCVEQSKLIVMAISEILVPN